MASHTKTNMFTPLAFASESDPEVPRTPSSPHLSPRDIPLSPAPVPSPHASDSMTPTPRTPIPSALDEEWKPVPRKTKTMKIATSYKDAKKFERSERSERPRDTDLTATRPCNNIQLHGKCTREVCSFAHSMEELRVLPCNFASRGCKNTKCTFYHPPSTTVFGETMDEYWERVAKLGREKPDLPPTSESTRVPRTPSVKSDVAKSDVAKSVKSTSSSTLGKVAPMSITHPRKKLELDIPSTPPSKLTLSGIYITSVQTGMIVYVPDASMIGETLSRLRVTHPDHAWKIESC